MPTPPEWISKLVEQACLTIQLFDEEPPFGCHYYLNEQLHEISLFVSATEVVGGPDDGCRMAARLIVDVIDVMKLFDIVDSITWQPQPIDRDDEVGPHLSVMGTVYGHDVHLRILAATPDIFPAGRIEEAAEGRFVNVWDDQN